MPNYFRKNTTPIFLIILLVLCAVTYTAYAAGGTSPHSGKNPPTAEALKAKASFEKGLQARITQYESFLSYMPASLSTADRAALSAEIVDAINRLQVRLDGVNGTSTSLKLNQKGISTGPIHPATSTKAISKSISKSTSKKSSAKNASSTLASSHAVATSTAPIFSEKDDALLAVKINALRVAFHATGLHAVSNVKTKGSAAVAVLPAMSASSTVSADVLHKLIAASTSKDIQLLQKQVFAQAFPKQDFSKIKNSIAPKKVSKPKVIEPVVPTPTPSEPVSPRVEPVSTSTAPTEPVVPVIPADTSTTTATTTSPADEPMTQDTGTSTATTTSE